MCTNSIKATVRIPFREKEPDLNGNIYSEGIVELLAETFCGPLPIKYWIGEHQVEVGLVNAVSVGYDSTGIKLLICECEFYRGGTREWCETVKDGDQTIITSAVLKGIGMSSLYI